MEEQEKSGLDSTVLVLLETVAKESVCAFAPKLVAALQKDLDNMADIHIFKKEALKLILSAVKEAQSLCDCPVKE